jgi:hypothetical protein
VNRHELPDSKGIQMSNPTSIAAHPLSVLALFLARAFFYVNFCPSFPKLMTSLRRQLERSFFPTMLQNGYTPDFFFAS